MKYKTNTGLVLQVDTAGTITSVFFQNQPVLPVEEWLGKSILTVIDPEIEEATLFLLESVKEFGHAEAWPLHFLVNEVVYKFYCNAAFFADQIILMIYESTGNIISLDLNASQNQPDVTAEPGPEILDKPEAELLDELSRLNNELVNTKRELIRQNVKLKRLQNPWEEGLTFI